MPDLRDRAALVTNATGFTGPAAVAALLGAGFRIFAHDPAFHDVEAATAFVDGQGAETFCAREPEDVVTEATRRAGALQAIDWAADGVTVNAVGPNFLYSEAYYPSALFRDTKRGRDYVRRSVPVGRLAEREEIGEVIAFLATAKTRFLTGSIIEFSGGWPFGEARPSA